MKTQGSLPSEEAAVVLLFSLVASGQIKLRKIDGWRKIAAALNHRAVATKIAGRRWHPTTARKILLNNLHSDLPKAV